MGRSPALALLAGLAVLTAIAPAGAGAAPSPRTEAARRALREDGSLKVRAQAAVVLGQSGAADAVPDLARALAEDEAPAVRIAAASALGRLGHPGGRTALARAARSDLDASVRDAAQRAIAALPADAPPVHAVEDATASRGAEALRGPLREAVVRHLGDRGLREVERRGWRLKPAVLLAEARPEGTATAVAVRAGLVVLDGGGRVVAMLESGARLRGQGDAGAERLLGWKARAIDAAARSLCEDLAGRLGER
jgi:hypothetical protein